MTICQVLENILDTFSPKERHPTGKDETEREKEPSDSQQEQGVPFPGRAILICAADEIALCSGQALKACSSPGPGRSS